MTPYELMIHSEVFAEQKKVKREEKLTLLWLGEYLQRVDKTPSLKEFLGKEEKPKTMTADEMLQKVMQLNSALNGTTQKAGEK